MKLVVALVLALATSVVPAGSSPELPPPVARSYGAPDEPPGPPPATGNGGRQRSEIDEADADPGAYQTHAIYFVPKDRTDQDLDSNGTIARSLDSLRDWFSRETKRNGLPGRVPRIDRTSQGAYDITFVRGLQNTAAYTSLGVLSDELILRGFNAATKRYLVYAAIDRANICGEAYFPLPGLTSKPYAAVYLDSSRCSARDWGGGSAATAGKTETIVAHEWLHNEGVASPLAPRHCATSMYHLCLGPLWATAPDLDPENTDVMFPLVNLKLGAKIADLGNDDYLDHGWPHLSDLRDSAYLE